MELVELVEAVETEENVVKETRGVLWPLLINYIHTYISASKRYCSQRIRSNAMSL